MNTMTITVLDTATIFEAEETIYRYDLPGTGITKGWAIDGVLEQAKNQLPDWPDVEIIIDADTEIVDILSQALTGQAVTTIPTEADSTDLDLTEPDLAESEELEPVERRFQFQWKNIALYVAMVVVAGIIGVISWQAVGSSPPVESAVTEVHNYGVLDIELPTGFHLEPTGAQSVTLTGADTNLRILVAADPLNDAPSEAVFTELTHMITNDPALTQAEALNTGHGKEIGYREHPVDGSEVWWTVWVDSGHMVSFGCHSKTGAPSLPQRATCRQIAQKIMVRG